MKDHYWKTIEIPTEQTPIETFSVIVRKQESYQAPHNKTPCVDIIVGFPPYVATFHWTAGNQGEFAHHTPEPSICTNWWTSWCFPCLQNSGKPSALRRPPRAREVAQSPSFPSHLIHVLPFYTHVWLTKKKSELAYRQPQHRNTPFCKRIKKTGAKNHSGWGYRCSQRGVLCGSERCLRSDVCIDSEEKPAQEEEKRENTSVFCRVWLIRLQS